MDSQSMEVNSLVAVDMPQQKHSSYAQGIRDTTCQHKVKTHPKTAVVWARSKGKFLRIFDSQR
eukprot:1296105-Amphidinium_carterae.1